tara:strand:+ start:367 stop:579 length:213 start_codon:yes stop_codon:yes gene_type:complete
MIIYKNNKTACLGAAFSIIALFTIFINAQSKPMKSTYEYSFPTATVNGKAPEIQQYNFYGHSIYVKNKGI